MSGKAGKYGVFADTSLGLVSHEDESSLEGISSNFSIFEDIKLTNQEGHHTAILATCEICTTKQALFAERFSMDGNTDFSLFPTGGLK